MICPQCKTKYREGFTTCSDCRLDLVSELPSEEQKISGEGHEALSEKPYLGKFVKVFTVASEGELVVLKSLLDTTDIAYYFKNQSRLQVSRPEQPPVDLMVEESKVGEMQELLQGFKDSGNAGTLT